MRLVSDPIAYDAIAVDDIITFDYTNAGMNVPSRVGEVAGFHGGNPTADNLVLLWDYSVPKGPKFRSYRSDYIKNLGRIISLPDKPSIGRLDRYKNNTINFVRRILGFER